MSLFTYWRFRSARPTLEAGDEIVVYLTEFDPDTGKARARIGDTVLTIDGADRDQLDELVRLHVESFNPEQSAGTARLIGRT